MDTDFWLDRARESIARVEAGRCFVLKDLFEGVEWAKVSRGDKLELGRVFKNHVMEKRFPDVVHIGKAQNNSATYQKTGGK